MHFIYNSTVVEFKLGRSCVLHKHFTLLFFCLKFVDNITWFCCISHKVYTVCGKLTINMCVPSYSYILVVWENNISAFPLLHEYKKSLTKPEKNWKRNFNDDLTDFHSLEQRVRAPFLLTRTNSGYCLLTIVC